MRALTSTPAICSGEMDAEPYRIALDDAQFANAALQAQKALYREGYRQEDIEQARANLDARVATQVNAEQVYQRQLKLADTGASAQKALDDARSQRDQAVALARGRATTIQELSRGYRKHEVEEVNANAARAAAQLEQARLQLADTRLTAPADGTILTRAVEPGSMLAAGGTVLTLSLDVRFGYAPMSAKPISAGWRRPGASRSTPMRAPQPYDGVIGFVSPTSEFTPKNVETQDLRTALVYRLRVVVEDPDAALRQGMPVTVKLDGGN